jgi:iron complex outermembrane receptor protein
VASIEVYKGSAPVNFGASSIGGVINIKTLRTEEGFSANAGVGYGSFNTRNAKGYINHKPGRFDYLISGDALASDNNYEIYNDKNTEWNPYDDQTEERNNAQFEQYTLLGKAGYDVTDTSRIDFLTQWFSKDQGIPSRNNEADTITSLPTDRSLNTLKYTHDSIGGAPLNSSVQINYTYKDELYDDHLGQVGLGKQKTTYRTDRYGGSLFGEWLASWHTLTATLDLAREDYETEDLLKDEINNSSTRNTLILGAQDQLYLFDDSLLLVPALRYTYVDNDITAIDGPVGGEVVHTTGSDDYLSPQFGLKYSPTAWVELKSNIGQYVRLPHFYELSGDRGLLIGNPDIEAEEGINFDAGFKVSSYTDLKWMPRFGFNAAYFQSKIDNLIAIVYGPNNIGHVENVEGAEIKGVEAGFNADLWRYFRLILNGTYQDTKNLDERKAFYGNQLPGRWKQQYLARLEAAYWQVKLWVEYRLKGDMYYDTANLLKAENQKLLDAGFSWLWDPFVLSFTASNIQDNSYEDFNGYPMPGRSLFISLNYNY